MNNNNSGGGDDGSSVILIHDPIIFDKKSAEESLKKNVLQLYSNNTSAQFGQIFKNEMFVLDKNKNTQTWKMFERPTNVESIMETTSWEEREINIEKKLSKFNILQNNNSKFYMIPEGQMSLTCNVDTKTPFIFTLSNIINSKYFDTVVIPENLPDDHAPLYYSKLSIKDVPYKHSGDERSGNMLLQHLTFTNNNKETKKCYAGCVVFQGYRKQSFISLRDCEPNICITDKNNDGSFNVWIYHFPLIKDFVGNSSIAFMAKFEYSPESNTVKWSFLKQPFFSEERFDVGLMMKRYQKDFKKFNDQIKEKHSSTMKIINNNNQGEYLQNFKRLKLHHHYYHHKKNNDDNVLLIIQEPLLKREKESLITKNMVEKISNLTTRNNIYTFHHNIKKYNVDDEDDDEDEDKHFALSLPIGGGSVISEHALIKLSKPMKNSEISIEYSNDIKYSKKAIMIVSNDYNIANAPIIYSKINACFIVVNNNDVNLNDLNISLALIHQGPLSTIFMYMPSTNKYFYIRGLCGDDNLKYGDEVKLEDIINKYGWSSSSSLTVPAFPQNTDKQSIYDINGKEVFTLTKENSENFNFILTAVEKYANEIYIKEEEDEKRLILALNVIFAQLEVVITGAVFNEMIKMLANKLKNIHTKGSVFKFLLEKELIRVNDENYINNNVIDNSAFNKQWLQNELKKCLPKEITNDFIAFNTYILNVKKELDRSNHHKKYNEIILDVLQRCVSTKSSYGTRKRDVSKMVKVQSNVLNVKWLSSKELDSVLTKGCEQEGALIYKINFNQLQLALKDEERDDINFLSRDDRFFETPGDLAATYLESSYNEGGKEGYTLAFKYNNSPMIIIPILDNMIKIMSSVESVTKHNWTTVIPNGDIDYARIMLRNTVSHLMKERGIIIEASSPIVGRMVLRLLCNAIQRLTGNINHLKSNENDGIVKKVRGLMGLIFSIMASGVDKPLTPLYQTFLYKNFNRIPKFNFIEDVYFVEQILDFWPWVKLDELKVKSNVIKFVSSKINNIITATLPQVSADDDNIRKKIQLFKVGEKKKYNFEVVRPLVTLTISCGNTNNEEFIQFMTKADEELTTYSKPNIKNFNVDNNELVKEEKEGNIISLLICPQERQISSFNKLTNDEIFFIENKMSNYIKNRQEYLSKEKSKRCKNKTYFSFINENNISFIQRMLKFFDNKNNNNNNDDNNSLIKGIKRLKTFLTSSSSSTTTFNNVDMQKTWTLVQSIAYDNFIKRGAILKIFIEPILREINDKIILKNLNDDDDDEEVLIKLKQSRANLFKVFFNFHNPFYKYGHLPCPIKALSLCQTINDFICIYIGYKNLLKLGRGRQISSDDVKKYSNVLFIYMYHSNSGHFDNLNVNANDDEREEFKNMINKRHEKIIKIVTNNSTAQKMWSWFSKNNNDDDDDDNSNETLKDRIKRVSSSF